MAKNEVKTAIELLLEEVGRTYNTLNRELQKAVELEEFDRVQYITRMCQEVKAFKEKVENLKSEWQDIFSGVAYTPTKNGSVRKKGK
jgi:transcription initiation factor TFIIIB Brf1 subunit/transcription initiation factor TFIIB